MCEVIRSQNDSYLSLSPPLSLSDFLSHFLSCQGLLREAHPHTPSSWLSFFLSPFLTSARHSGSPLLFHPGSTPPASAWTSWRNHGNRPEVQQQCRGPK